MRWGFFLQIWFIIYCVEAGVFLLLAPWSPAWSRALLEMPSTRLYLLGIHPAVRAAISGFGLVHLVWGAHDLDSLLRRRRREEAHS